jgi:hypothetical protein
LERVRKRHESGEVGGERCPGEELCDRLRRAAPDEDKEKLVKTCPLCRGRGPFVGVEDTHNEMLLDRLERVVDERSSGRPVCLKEMEPDLWELLILWDRFELEFRLAHEKRMAALYETLLTRT